MKKKCLQLNADQRKKLEKNKENQNKPKAKTNIILINHHIKVILKFKNQDSMFIFQTVKAAFKSLH